MDMLGATAAATPPASASTKGTATNTTSSSTETDTNGESAPPDHDQTLGALAAAYDEAHKSWQDSKDSAGAWYSAYDDVHAIVNQKAVSGDAPSIAIHKHLGGLMDQVKKDRDAVGAAKFASGVKSAMNWVARKQPGKPLTDALDEISDSEDGEDQNGKATSGKERTRTGKLAGLSNIAAKAKTGGAVGGAGVGANDGNGAKAVPKSETHEGVKAFAVKGAKGDGAVPVGRKKAAKPAASDEEASDDEEEGSNAEGCDDDDEADSASASGNEDEQDDEEEVAEAADSEEESDAEE